MHVRDDPRLMRFRDGFWFSREILQREHAELETLRLQLYPNSMGGAVHAVATAWQIVDVVHRVRDLAEGMPGVNKKAGSCTRAFLDATAIAERFRHYVQHLRGEVSKTEVNRFPVWGSLSWVSASDDRTLHTTFLGVMRPGIEFHAGVFDAQGNRWVSRVSLSIGHVHFNVDPIVGETTAFCDHMLSVIDELQPGLPCLGVLEPFSTRFEIVDGDYLEAKRALPRALPREMVEAFEKRATTAGTTPGELLDEEMEVWRAAGTPRGDVPQSVHTACAELPPGTSTLVRMAYHAVAWSLRADADAAQSEAAGPTSDGDH